MSRRIVHAPLALTIEGALLLNAVEFSGPAAPEMLVRTALTQRGAIFVGVALDPHEVRRFARDVELVLPNAIMPIVGRRLRRR